MRRNKETLKILAGISSGDSPSVKNYLATLDPCLDAAGEKWWLELMHLLLKRWPFQKRWLFSIFRADFFAKVCILARNFNTGSPNTEWGLNLYLWESYWGGIPGCCCGVVGKGALQSRNLRCYLWLLIRCMRPKTNSCDPCFSYK